MLPKTNRAVPGLIGVKLPRWTSSKNDANDPDVWSGRASQKVFIDLSACGLASMYPASDWSVLCSGHHGYQRACGLVSGQASIGLKTIVRGVWAPLGERPIVSSGST
jgi:hypothetical protein